jgi:hypothetical protein
MDTAEPAVGLQTEQGEGLRTELSLVDAAAFSVGLIGPVERLVCWGPAPRSSLDGR